MCLAGFSIISHSEAIPWASEENMALDADAIVVGRIISYQDDGAHRYYEISIIKWIKNPQPDQTITMRSITPKVFNPHVPYAIFDTKDLGLFYLKSIDGEWRSTNYSKQIWSSEISQTIYDMKKLVGNNNPDSSVSMERVCKEGYVNAVKNRTGEIACVKPQTLQKLRERGWAEPLGDVVFQRPSTSSTYPNAKPLKEGGFTSDPHEVIPWLFMLELEKRGIDYENAPSSGWHAEEDLADPAKVCSPIITSNSTKLYISATFHLEPLEITDILIDSSLPKGCQQFWNTDTGIWN